MDYRYVNEVKIYIILSTYEVISKSELSSWIDRKIEYIEEPPDVFIDSAFLTSGSLKDILHIFNDYIWCKDIDNDKVMKGVLDIFNKKYLKDQIGCRKGIEILSNIVRELDCEDKFEDILDLEYRLLFLDDDLIYYKDEYGYSEEELRIEEASAISVIREEFEESIYLNENKVMGDNY